jgi:drug/metabolite transporter (DMT)-like permease
LHSTPKKVRKWGRALWLSALVVLLNNLGNLSLAVGLRPLSKALALDPLDYVRAMLNPFVALGVGLLVLWLLTRMALLSWADLSFVVPVTSAGYIVGVALAKLFLKEAVGPRQWLGTILIAGGAALAGSAAAKTERLTKSEILAKAAP